MNDERVSSSPWGQTAQQTRSKATGIIYYSASETNHTGTVQKKADLFLRSGQRFPRIRRASRRYLDRISIERLSSPKLDLDPRKARIARHFPPTRKFYLQSSLFVRRIEAEPERKRDTANNGAEKPPVQSIDQSIDLPLFSVREDANAGLPNWRRESSTNESAFFEHDCLVRWLMSRQTETKVRNERERERERERTRDVRFETKLTRIT